MSKSDDAEARRHRLVALAEDQSEPDTSDIPERAPGTWAAAAAGHFYRPRKRAVTIRLDVDLLDWFRRASGEKGYQTAINAALREYVAAKGGQL